MVTIMYHPANVRGLGPSCFLRPGINEVPADVWNRYKSAPAIVRLLDEGGIEVVDVAGAKVANGNKPKRGGGRRKKSEAQVAEVADNGADGETSDDDDASEEGDLDEAALAAALAQ